MRRAADVVIVGGGITGLTTALHLMEEGVNDVLVVERHLIGAGQSSRAAGVVRATVQHPVVAATQLEGQRFFSTFAERYGQALDVHRTGYLLLAAGSDRAQVDTTRVVAGAAGCVVDEIDMSRLAVLQPGLGTAEETICLYEPAGMYVDPMPATHAVSLAARQAGVQFLEDCPVRAIRIERERVVGVETDVGSIDAPVVFLATSVWAQPLLAASGIPLPVRPHIAEMAFFHVPPKTNFQLQRIVYDARSGLYMRPEHNHLLFVGRRESDYYRDDGSAVDPDNYRQTATHQTVKEMRQRLASTLPPMEAGFVQRTYACTYDVTPDEMPILDRLPGTANLYFALGFSGGGFSTAPWIGKRMASWIRTGQRPSELDIFSSDRFRTGKLIRWANVTARV